MASTTGDGWRKEVSTGGVDDGGDRLWLGAKGDVGCVEEGLGRLKDFISITLCKFQDMIVS